MPTPLPSSTTTTARPLFTPNLLGAARFITIGVQKPRINAVGWAPHEVWRVELTATPGLIEQGRKKYSPLLRHHARQIHRRRVAATPPLNPRQLVQAA